MAVSYTQLDVYKRQEQGGVGCAFRVLAGDVGKTLLACLLCRYVCGAELGTLAAAYALSLIHI